MKRLHNNSTLTSLHPLIVGFLTLFLMTLCIVLFTPRLSQAQTTPSIQPNEKADASLIREFVELLDFKDAMVLLVNHSIEQYQPVLTTEQMDEVQKEIQDFLNSGQIEQIAVMVYQQYFNNQDIQLMIDFYQTPTGQKLIANQAPIMQAVMAQTQQAMQNMLSGSF